MNASNEISEENVMWRFSNMNEELFKMLSERDRGLWNIYIKVSGDCSLVAKELSITEASVHTLIRKICCQLDQLQSRKGGDCPCLVLNA